MNIKNNLLIVLVVILNGCSTYVNVKVLKPAKFNLSDTKKVAIMDFDYVGSWTFDVDPEPETFTEIAKEALKSTFGLDKEKQEPPHPTKAFPGTDVSAKFRTKLVNNGHFTVIEREELEKVLDEQSLSMTGLVDDIDAAYIGKLLGVDAIILGSGSYSVTDNGGWYEQKYKDKDGKKHTSYTYKVFRLIDVVINYKVVSVETGQILASAENSSANYDESKIFFPYDDFSEEETKEDARANVPDWKPIVNKLTNKVISKSIKQIAPYYKKEDREIKTGSTGAMKAGLKYAERKLWDDAKESWELVLEDNSTNGQKDHVPAMYNVAIYYEIHGDLDKAEELFDKCFKLSGKSEYLDARARIQKRKKELIKLEEQQNQN
ncbi:MAG: hypothetical protein HQ509_05705 [Candidatus Marinimicrobia bacterium]|nr:hypothetical protein [Candidatus Neomarinimicrobiota bacterium]